MFDGIDELEKGVEVKVGDGRSLWATGKGRVRLQMNLKSGKRVCTLGEVLFVPKLAFNLFSVTRAAEAGKMTVFTREGCKVRDEKSGSLIAVGWKEKGLYYIDEGDEVQCVFTASAELWHRRFGHLGRQSMGVVKGLVDGLEGGR